MMQATTYRVTHTTSYQYETPVRVCHNLVMLTPRNDWCVRAINHRVQIKPTPTVQHRREDYFGNSILAFSIEESHRQLIVTASGRVEVQYQPPPPPDTTPAWEMVRDSVLNKTDPRWLEACQFRFDSPRVKSAREYEQYAVKSFRPGRPILEGVIDLNQRIHRDFKYDPTATSVHTPTDEAYRLRRGVCQDFAHVQIACLRALGLSARYVSGYLRTHTPSGQPRLIGADQSHAWVSVYCGQRVGWIDVDPTNDKMSDLDHIPIAWGRDYGDVIPVRGVFLGGGQHQVLVAVDVVHASDASSS
jgi:transglutaminase-like putative cysteine protease